MALDRKSPEMMQQSLFAPAEDAVPVKPADSRPVQMRILITVKAAPNPSESYGETVCVAGLCLNLETPGWVRLYPINFRELDDDSKFHKYDVVTLTAVPSPRDPRAESWRPRIDTLAVDTKLSGWPRRQDYVNDHIGGTMCGLIEAAKASASAKSLAAIRPRRVIDLVIDEHGGWTPDERRKIDSYVRQLELPGTESRPKTALEAPRYKGWYRYLCESPDCGGHRQGIYDWEWVALQRNLRHLDDQDARAALRARFLEQICGPDKDLVFFVGNQQKRPAGFMVLGLFYPPAVPRR